MKEALKQIIDLLQPVAALTDRAPFEHSEVIQRCVDASEIALEALAQSEQEPVAWQVEMFIAGAWVPLGNPQRDKTRAEALASNPSLSKENQRLVSVYTTPPQEERNFCSRCGKRTADLTVIHTCTPPKENL